MGDLDMHGQVHVEVEGEGEEGNGGGLREDCAQTTDEIKGHVGNVGQEGGDKGEGAGHCLSLAQGRGMGDEGLAMHRSGDQQGLEEGADGGGAAVSYVAGNATGNHVGVGAETGRHAEREEQLLPSVSRGGGAQALSLHDIKSQVCMCV